MQSDTQQLPDLSRLKDDFTVVHAWEKLNLDGIPARVCKSPFRPDKNPSFAIYDSNRKWKDYATGDSGDVIDFIAKASNLNNKDAIAKFRRMTGGEATTDTSTATTAPRVKNTLDDDQKSRRKAAERAAVKASLRFPTESEMQIIADLRKTSGKAVQYLAQDGLIQVGQWRDRPVFAITSGDFFQIRRMDGKRFWEGGPKELNMAEPTPAFVITRNLNPVGTRIMIAEGLVELLALTELEIRADDYRREHFPDSEFQPVAFAVASSASSRISDIVVESMRCKTIRIIPDNDEAGHKAAQKWTESLQAAGIATDNRLMPVGKDLGDALPAMPDSACFHLLQF